MVHEDAPHHHGRQADELRAVAPVDATLIDQAAVRLVHERRRLQRVAGPFAPEVLGGQAP
jgi:hypothetical protein